MNQEDKQKIRERLRYTSLEEASLILGFVLQRMLEKSDADFWAELQEAVNCVMGVGDASEGL